jgi:mono/diheme cytochrome c family protein
MLRIPRPMRYLAVLAVLASFLPLAWIAYVRSDSNEKRRIHLVQDMDNQTRFKAQQVNMLFADHRAMRPPVAGAVARGELREDQHLNFGMDGAGAWVTGYPAAAPMSRELMARGQERYNIYCSVCHGYAGYGDGIVHQRADRLVNNSAGPVNGTTWVQPKSLHDDTVRNQPPGQIFNTVTYGIRTMAGYASQIPVQDRWAIVAYVKALQRSQDAQPSDIPADRADLLQAASNR